MTRPPAESAPGRGSAWHESALAPFRTRVFLAIWIASLVSNFGTLVQTVGAAWLMTSLATSSQLVALVQAATALPIMLLSVPAGALADVWDRRRLMLLALAIMLAAATALTVLAFRGAVSPWTLLGVTFVLGCGAALYGPAWQSSVGEQVPREQLPAAVALNSLGFNIARTAGPAVGGVIVASAGPQAAFLFNALSYVALVVVLLRWRPPPVAHTLPPEDLPNAMGAGLRYARLSPVIRTVLLRSFVFGLLGSALWALLPLVARDLVGGGPLTFGFLLGAFGLGAVVGAIGSTPLRERYASEKLVSATTALFGLASLATAYSRWTAVTVLALFAAGAAWVIVLSTLNITTQTQSPRWVVGRALAVYQMAAFGGMALGSWAWGLYAEVASLPASLATAGMLLLVSLLLAKWFPLRSHEIVALDPARSPAEIEKRLTVPPHVGPVVVTVEYRVAPEDQPAFIRAMQDMSRFRRRDGARRWRLLQSLDDTEVFTERWQAGTWLEHLRQLQRATLADKEVRDRARAFHRGPSPPRVRHMLERWPDDEGPSIAGARAVVRTGTTDPNLPAGAAPAVAAGRPTSV